MIIMFLMGIFAAFSAQISVLSFSVHGLNRAINNTPIEVMYQSVIIYEGEAYFDKSNFENAINYYYDFALNKYVKEKEIDFYYYNPSDGSMCIDNLCSAVEITINCKLMFDVDITRSMYYELGGGKNG